LIQTKRCAPVDFPRIVRGVLFATGAKEKKGVKAVVYRAFRAKTTFFAYSCFQC